MQNDVFISVSIILLILGVWLARRAGTRLMQAGSVLLSLIALFVLVYFSLHH
jgi:hypothetical protein